MTTYMFISLISQQFRAQYFRVSCKNAINLIQDQIEKINNLKAAFK